MPMALRARRWEHGRRHQATSGWFLDLSFLAYNPEQRGGDKWPLSYSWDLRVLWLLVNETSFFSINKNMFTRYLLIRIPSNAAEVPPLDNVSGPCAFLPQYAFSQLEQGTHVILL